MFDKPDKTKWTQGDTRQSVEWDTVYFRELYNGTAPFKVHALPTNTVRDIDGHPFWVQCHGNALDVGCGNGLTLLSLLKHGMIDSGVGIDVSDVAIDSARQTAENIKTTDARCDCDECRNAFRAKFIRTPLEEFVTDRKFDTIISTDVLEHFFNVEWAVRKMHSLLKPDGIFIGGTPLERMCDDNVEHLHYFNADDLRHLFLPLYNKVCITCDDDINQHFVCTEPIPYPNWVDIQYRYHSPSFVNEKHARSNELHPKQRELLRRHLAQGRYIL